MDFQKELQKLADSIEAMTSIYSFEILPDGSFGEIKIIAANQRFLFALAQFPGELPTLQPGSPYKEYRQDVNFERFCYKCASSHEPLLPREWDALRLKPPLLGKKHSPTATACCLTILV